jgi:hypothetical protein
MPVNLIEQEALKGAIPWAKANDIATIVNRPLNAMGSSDEGDNAFRLASYPPVQKYSA